MPRLVIQLTETPETIDSRVAFGDAQPAHGQSTIRPSNMAALSCILKALNASAYDPADYWDDEVAALREHGLIQDSAGPIRFVPELTKRIGEHLFGWLFPNTETLAAYTDAQQAQRTFDIDLRFDADTRIVDALPWELVNNGLEFLVAGGRGQLTRHLTFRGWAPPCPEVPLRKLRVLVVKPRPRAGVSQLDDSEIDAIAAVDGVDLNILEPPTLHHLGEFVDGLTVASVPHVIHFDGHGVYGRRCENGHVSGRRAECCEVCQSTDLELSPQGYLAWVDADGDLDMVSAKDLATQLGVITDMENSPFRLVVLSACNSATVTGSQSAFDGTCQRLIREGIPGVIAMQFAVRADAAADFATRLYRNLAAGRPIPRAVALARTDLRLEDRQWYRPVAYLRYREVGAPDSELYGQFFRLLQDAPATLQVLASRNPEPAAESPTELVGAVNKAMTALSRQAATDPHLDSAVQANAEALAELSQRLELLGDLKDIHDQLHILKLRVFAQLQVDFDTPKQAPDAKAFARADNHDGMMAQICGAIADVAKRGNLSGADVVWLDELRIANNELRDGIDKSDGQLIRDGLATMKPALDDEPSRIDSRMRELARTLQLRPLTALLQAAVENPARTSPRAKQDMSVGLRALDSIANCLEKLTREHTSWQRLEIRLPARELLTTARRREFGHRWAALKPELMALIANSSDDYSVAIARAAAEVDRAVSLADPNEDVIEHFQDCVSGIYQRFFALDRELRALCGELRKLAAGVEALVPADQDAAIVA